MPVFPRAASISNLYTGQLRSSHIPRYFFSIKTWVTNPCLNREQIARLVTTKVNADEASSRMLQFPVLLNHAVDRRWLSSEAHIYATFTLFFVLLYISSIANMTLYFTWIVRRQMEYRTGTCWVVPSKRMHYIQTNNNFVSSSCTQLSRSTLENKNIVNVSVTSLHMQSPK